MKKNNDIIISLENIGVSYKRKKAKFRWQRDTFWALKDISLDLYRGESLGVIGRNGVGKTTLLTVIAGIILPDKGTITMDNCKSSLLSLQVGFVPYLSGRENAILSGMLLGLSKKEIEGKLDDIIEFSELEDFIDQPIGTYSAGMKARLGFSVAFQIDPEVLLIDEVLGVGDADFKKKSSSVMYEKLQSNKTVVLVSHNADTISEFCSRAVWIEQGVSRAEGNTKEVLAEYEQYLSIIEKKKKSSYNKFKL